MADPAHDDRARETRLAGAAATLGIAALALPAAVEAVAGTGGPALCPFRLLTGLPCPFCGGTRALAATARGDVDAALRFNAVWPVVAVVLVLAGAAGLVAARRGGAPLSAALAWARAASARRTRARTVVVVALVAVPWTTALVHRDAITSPQPQGTTADRPVTPAPFAVVPRERHDGPAMTVPPVRPADPRPSGGPGR